jgi:alpha-L-rhamnosidase
MPDGDVPHTAPTVGGGGGPAWSGFVVTMPWQTYRTFGDVDILEAMYPTMQKQLAFYEDKTCHKVQTSPCFSKGQQTICRPNCTSADGLLKPWTLSYWDFLGDWITPHGNEGPFCTHNNPCKGWDGTNDNPDALLFNNAYVAYITRLAAKIATILGKDKDAQMYITQAAARAAAINKAFYVPGTGGYYDTLQTHIVMPLSCGVVPKAQEEKVMAALEQQFLANKSHIDVGLTGNYFLTRLLTGDTLDIGRPSEGYQRNDLMMALTNQTTAPGYGFFLSQGYTTWPESWDAPKNGYQHELSRCEAAAAAAQAGDEHAEHSSAISKMHGCYNAIGTYSDEHVCLVCKCNHLCRNLDCYDCANRQTDLSEQGCGLCKGLPALQSTPRLRRKEATRSPFALASTRAP